MSKLNKILSLGNPKLYEKSLALEQEDLAEAKEVIKDLHDILMEFQELHGIGRAIAAPQIGYMKRLIYMYIDQPVVFINPELFDKSEEMRELWDDCLCFPELLVKVSRHKLCKIKYLDFAWQENEMALDENLSELLQHEYDHLDGILATQRAIDNQSFSLRKEIFK